jgi:hypothetical protein
VPPRKDTLILGFGLWIIDRVLQLFNLLFILFTIKTLKILRGPLTQIPTSKTRLSVLDNFFFKKNEEVISSVHLLTYLLKLNEKSPHLQREV